ncbi:hypothetical protein REC12_24315 [Desulfosporosinus sp. PR]|uniref:hypothetical protein n=1 Tax=Candidatus Desulfosporosinus nitrosoreducens TaxID=3401928 RepID=UPI0027EB6158|nr:hypothetical protein [Desulfosporosinus sp. PR]MDQ7096722.1 hypothetical protein [Desulfosporosinus sp. PR]
MKNMFRIASFVCLIFSISITVVWAVQTRIAYQDYIKHPEYSAPFWAYRLPEFIAYSISLIVGLVLTAVFKRISSRKY